MFNLGLFNLGPHAGFILASYAAGLAIIGGLGLAIMLRASAARKRLNEAERRNSGSS